MPLHTHSGMHVGLVIRPAKLVVFQTGNDVNTALLGDGSGADTVIGKRKSFRAPTFHIAAMLDTVCLKRILTRAAIRSRGWRVEIQQNNNRSLVFLRHFERFAGTPVSTFNVGGASTIRWASPAPPYTARCRSDCSVLVGMPVEVHPAANRKSPPALPR